MSDERMEIFSMADMIMSFIKHQRKALRAEGAEQAGLLDANQDNAYAQLTKEEINKTEKALRQLMGQHASKRRLAAILSIAIKAAAGKM